VAAVQQAYPNHLFAICGGVALTVSAQQTRREYACMCCPFGSSLKHDLVSTQECSAQTGSMPSADVFSVLASLPYLSHVCMSHQTRCTADGVDTIVCAAWLQVLPALWSPKGSPGKSVGPGQQPESRWALTTHTCTAPVWYKSLLVSCWWTVLYCQCNTC
jgi:hypothetical protein